MNYSGKVLIVFLVLSLVLGSTTAFSTYFANYSLEDLCEKSSNIVIAKVISFKSFKHNNKIYTSLYLNTTESIKGDIGNSKTFEIIRYGGTIGEISVFQVDEPNFKKGEETLLFLNEFLSNYFGRNYSILGLSEGKFNIINNMIYRKCPIPLNIKYKELIFDISKEEKAINKSILLNHIYRIIH